MRTQRSAFTLMELLLVLLIIVMMAVLTYPNIESMYAGVKLQAAADHLVSQFATARAHAIDEQRVYRFAIQPGTPQYRLAPDDPQFWGGDTGAGNQPEDDGTPPPVVIEGSLPGGINFEQLASGAQIAASSPDNGSWATILLFKPNGGCSDDTTVTMSNGGAPIQVSVRGLTGTVNMKMLKPGEN
jgi:prepilin-type N-terminal cleavage/methylation domain-containing protein